MAAVLATQDLLSTQYLSAIGGNSLEVVTIAGAFVFGISGGLAAVRARLDVFGVVVLAGSVGLAGGVLRDVLLNTRPQLVSDWRVIVAVVAAGLLSFFLRGQLSRWRSSMEIFDAIGISLFCVIGADVALAHHASPLSAIVLGVVTSIGGGVTRDVLLNRVPLVLREGLYAIPAALGASVAVAGWELGWATPWWYVLAGGLCLVVRLIGIRFDLNLPVAEPPGGDA